MYSVQTGMSHHLIPVTSLSQISFTSLSMMLRTTAWTTRCAPLPSPLCRDSHQQSLYTVVSRLAFSPPDSLFYCLECFELKGTLFTFLPFQVQEGGRVQLSANHIIASDPDTSQKDLLVWLISPPKYGFIENTKRGGF